jgi:uncharacterized protein (DUF488 family)
MSEHRRILTIGYGNRTLEAFLALLKQYAVRYLLDVRSVPYSRFKPEFNREAFDALLKRHGIEYKYCGDTLGGRPEDETLYTEDDKVDYNAMRNSEKFQQGLQSVIENWEAWHPVVLMCSELDPDRCHRKRLIGEALISRGIPVSHIDGNGHEQPHVRQQSLLADEPALTSLKRYPNKSRSRRT